VRRRKWTGASSGPQFSFS